MRGFILALVMRLRVVLWRRRRADRRWFAAWTLAASVIESVFLVFTLSVAVALVRLGAPIVGVVILALVGWLVLPHWLLTLVTIPRGWHRASAVLARFDPRRDDQAWTAVMAARAAARAGSPPAAVAWITGRLTGRLDASGVVVHALLASGRGDRADARRLMTSVRSLVGPPSAIDCAAEWVAIDAAERGAWSELAADGAPDATAPWPATPLRQLLEAVAARAVGASHAPSTLGLWLRWLAAPARRHTWALLRRPPAVTAPPADHLTLEHAPGDRARQVLGHARASRRPAAVAAAVEAWSAVTDDPAWTSTQLERAHGLGLDATAARTAVDAARDHLVAHLAELVVTTGAPLPSGTGAVATAVRVRARRHLLDGLEITFARTTDRIAADQRLPAIDEWRAFVALAAAYEAAVAPGGVELDRVAFPHADSALGDLVVWLWNRRGEHVLARAVIEWLYQRAAVVGDTAAVELHGRNRTLTIPDA